MRHCPILLDKVIYIEEEAQEDYKPGISKTRTHCLLIANERVAASDVIFTFYPVHDNSGSWT